MNRNQRYSAARAWAHDWVCMSPDCCGDNDHARRTQREFAAQAVGKGDPAGAIHLLLCLQERRGECAHPKHPDRAAALAAEHFGELSERAS